MKNPLVFILSWQRPLYLWACLDSLHKTTTVPCRFVLLDNASSDPLIGRVIDSFENRDFFYRVHRNDHNNAHALADALDDYKHELGEYFGFVESDVMVLSSRPCWLEEFQNRVGADPRIAMLGSLIDKADFIDPAWFSKRYPQFTEDEIEFLTKKSSAERQLSDEYAEPLIDSLHPPGRLLFLRTEVVQRTGVLPDMRMSREVAALGYKYAIATRVRHRHLSLANPFDYPEYDKPTRDKFFGRLVHEKRKK